jgi:hypothetical protein
LHREQRADCHWQRELFLERRWLLDACQEGPAAAGFEIFQANAAVTRGSRSATPHAETAFSPSRAPRPPRDPNDDDDDEVEDEEDEDQPDEPAVVREPDED